MAVNFFQEDIKFNLTNKLKIKKWLRQLATGEGFRIKDLNYIFCSDEYLYHINLEYLKHDTYTDIITFDNSDEAMILEGDIFISVDRVQENSDNRKDKFNQELIRVLSHGLFHLCGYKDKQPMEKKIMRDKEDQAISRYYSLTTDTVPRGTPVINQTDKN